MRALVFVVNLALSLAYHVAMPILNVWNAWLEAIESVITPRCVECRRTLTRQTALMHSATAFHSEYICPHCAASSQKSA